MRRFARRVSGGTSARLRALDRRLHIDHRGRSEWIWAAPVFTFLGTVGLVIFAGAVISDTTPLLFTPVALLVGLLMAGMSVAYMTPVDDGGEDGGDGGRGPGATRPPRPLLDWSRWLREPHGDRLPEEPAAPPRRREREGEPERTGEPARRN